MPEWNFSRCRCELHRIFFLREVSFEQLLPAPFGEGQIGNAHRLFLPSTERVDVGILHQHDHSFTENPFAVVDVVHSLALLDPEDLIKIMIVKIVWNRRVEKATGKVVMLPCGHKAFQRESIHGKSQMQL